MNVRLLAEDDVLEILCKYIQDSRQKKIVWDSTIKKDQFQYYSWNANPYVWVTEFEVIDKAAALADVGGNDAKEK